MEKLSLSPEKYGAGRRFYIQTLDDHALSPDVQEKLRAEIKEAKEKIGGEDIPHDELMALPYLDAVCRETLRV